jgi:hypothetical protein
MLGTYRTSIVRGRGRKEGNRKVMLERGGVASREWKGELALGDGSYGSEGRKERRMREGGDYARWMYPTDVDTGVSGVLLAEDWEEQARNVNVLITSN